MPKGIKTLGNSKALAWESRGFVQKKRIWPFGHTLVLIEWSHFIRKFAIHTWISLLFILCKGFCSHIDCFWYTYKRTLNEFLVLSLLFTYQILIHNRPQQFVFSLLWDGKFFPAHENPPSRNGIYMGYVDKKGSVYSEKGFSGQHFF